MEAREAAKRSDEMGQRQAMSRSYYAAYHWADSISGHLPNPPQGGGVHQELIDRMRLTDRKKVRGGTLANRIAPLLARGREGRVKADYYLEGSISESETKAAIANAELVQSLVAEFSRLHTA